MPEDKLPNQENNSEKDSKLTNPDDSKPVQNDKIEEDPKDITVNVLNNKLPKKKYKDDDTNKYYWHGIMNHEALKECEPLNTLTGFYNYGVIISKDKNGTETDLMRVAVGQGGHMKIHFSKEDAIKIFDSILDFNENHKEKSEMNFTFSEKGGISAGFRNSKEYANFKIDEQGISVKQGSEEYFDMDFIEKLNKELKSRKQAQNQDKQIQSGLSSDSGIEVLESKNLKPSPVPSGISLYMNANNTNKAKGR